MAPIAKVDLTLRGHRKSWISVCALSIALMAAGAGSARAQTPTPRVPQGFVGTVLDGPMWPVDPGVDLPRQLDAMVGAGVESVRVQIDWAQTQPYQGWGDVPSDQRSAFTDVDGLPLKLAAFDLLVQLCAQRGLTIRPVVLDAPNWDSVGPALIAQTPASNAPFGTFLQALVHRYGPQGSLWSNQAPREPIRMWQIWNEPNLDGYWAYQPNFEPSYVRMLKVAHAAIKSADPGAKVILAGMVNHSWEYLKQIYEVPGARRLFDIAAVHPYTRNPSGVLTILRYFRRAMDYHGDHRKPMLADELGWNSVGKIDNGFGIEVTRAVQARNLAALLPVLQRERQKLGLLAFDYYNWAGVEQPGSYEFNFAGLFALQGRRFIAKPVFRVFRADALSMERCHQKARVATRCVRAG